MEIPSSEQQLTSNEFGFFLPERPVARLEVDFSQHEGLPNADDYYIPHIRATIKDTLGALKLDYLTVINANKNSGADLAIPAHKFVSDQPDDLEELTKQLQNALGSVQVKTEGSFINMCFDRTEAAIAVVGQVLELGENYGMNNSGQGKVTVLDVSSPNIAKEMHLGHLRSTVIGEALARILQANGNVTIRDNHLGDWGTQFGMLGHAYDLWADQIPELASEETQVSGLLKLYVRINNEIAKQKEEHPDQESELEQAGRAWFAKLEQGDPGANELWRWAYDLSLKEFEQVYRILGVDFEYMLGESLYATFNEDVYRVFVNAGIAEHDDKGRLQIQPSNVKLPPLTIRKSDGSSLYGTRDLACLVARKEWFKPEEVIYVVGDEQEEYFKQLFDGFEQLGHGHEDMPGLTHVGFGPVELPTGKMSTRAGNVVILADVINEVRERAYAQVSQNMSQRGVDMTSRELADIADAVSVGAIIYYDLKQAPGRKIVFNWDEALSFTGNTGPYLQYTNARLNTLLEKYSMHYSDEANEDVDLTVLEQDEANRDLVMLLGEFPEAVKLAGEKLNPTIVAELLYKIAHSYNGYYTNNRVIDEPSKDVRKSRILLAAAVQQTLRNGLTMLNIPMPLRM